MDRYLIHGEAERQGERHHLDVESETINALPVENLLRNILPKQLQATLSVAVRDAGQFAEHEVEELARSLTVEGLSDIEHGMRKTTRPHRHVGTLSHMGEDLHYGVGSGAQIGIAVADDRCRHPLHADAHRCPFTLMFDVYQRK